MNGVNHAISGLAAYGTALVIGHSHFDQTLPSPTITILGATVAVGAALAADIDEKHSKASQSAGVIGSVARLATGSHRTRTHWPLLTIPLLSAWCWYLIAHAGAGWSLGVTCGVLVAIGWPFATAMVLPKGAEKAVAAVSIPAGAVLAWWMATRGIAPAWWLYAAIPVPYLAHIIGDTPTPAGIAWAGPLSTKKFSAHLFHSGGFVELSIVTPLLVAASLWAGWQLIEAGAFSGPWAI
jgi:membrane-bound metal-dependent hydrolase YbcI (DUF457 family)